MKYLRNRIAILALAIASIVWSCGEADPIFYSGGDFVSFQADAVSVVESGSIDVTITRSTADLSSALTVDVTVSGEYASTTGFADAGDDATGTYTVNTTSVEFAADEASKTITISGIDDFDASGNKDVSIEISNVSDASYNIGQPGPSSLRSSILVSLIDDDCPFDINDFVGTYDVNEDNGADQYTANATLGASPNTLLIDNWWGSGLSAEVTLDFSDPANPVAYVLPQDGGAQLCCGANAWVTSRPDPAATASPPAMAGLPDGSFSTCGLSINVDFYVYVPSLGTFNSSQPINAVFTLQ